VDQILADESVASLTSAGDVLWPLTDHLNTTRDLAEYNSGTNTASIASHRIFDSFGNLISESNGSVTILFSFTARPFDVGSGLQWNLNRWYISTLGVWMSEDPMGFAAEDANVRRYVGNNPTRHVDPTGKIATAAAGAWQAWGDYGDAKALIDLLHSPVSLHYASETSTDWYDFKIGQGQLQNPIKQEVERLSRARPDFAIRSVRFRAKIEFWEMDGSTPSDYMGSVKQEEMHPWSEIRDSEDFGRQFVSKFRIHFEWEHGGVWNTTTAQVEFADGTKGPKGSDIGDDVEIGITYRLQFQIVYCPKGWNNTAEGEWVTLQSLELTKFMEIAVER
jgi:RHS repeat-associated protein